jgi:alkylhydroperoxidase family enzyme
MKAAIRVPPIDPANIDDPEYRKLLTFAAEFGTPRPLWYLTTAHNAEIAKASADWWNAVFHAGRVEHSTKEMMRNLIVQLKSCGFCSVQRSKAAIDEGLDENAVLSCALPHYVHPNPRVQAALRFARELVLDRDDCAYEDVYQELLGHFDYAEIIELGLFASEVIGTVTFVKSLGLAKAIAADPERWAALEAKCSKSAHGVPAETP